MRVTKIEYRSLRKTAAYENDTLTVEVELEKGDNVGEAIARAKETCERGLRGTLPTTYKGF
jgi:hypothetical protein